MNIMNLIRRGRVSNATPDTLRYPRTQIKTPQGVREVEELYHYGSFGVAPVTSLVVSFAVGGEESNLVAIAYAPSLRPLDLQVGEYACGNFLKKNFIRFNEDGTVKLITPNGDVIETLEGGGINITTTGVVNVEAAGDATVTAANVNVVASGDANITATNANIDAKCNLGTGGLPIARTNDMVVVDILTGIGSIVAGSPNHTAS